MKKKLGILVILLIAVFTVPVFAVEDDLVTIGESVTVGEDVDIENTVNSSSFTVGDKINLKSFIDGLSFVAGNDITISSRQDHLFSAGRTIHLVNAEIKDAFIAGETITIDSSTIRDLYAAGKRITINSEISRDAYLTGDKITIHGNIMGDVKVAAAEIIIEDGSVINGTLKYPEEAKITVSETASIMNRETYKSNKNTIVRERSFADKVSFSLISYLSLLVVGFVLLAINKKFFKNILEEERDIKYLLKMAFYGLGLLVCIPIACIIGLITIVGIPISIITLIMYGICIYLSMIPSAYYLGNWILKDKIKNEYLILAIALCVLTILKFIPVVGGLIRFICFVFGFSLLLKVMLKTMREN